MELVTRRDMDDAKALAESAGVDMIDDYDGYVHDLAQAIADGRRPFDPFGASASLLPTDHE